MKQLIHLPSTVAYAAALIGSVHFFGMALLSGTSVITPIILMMTVAALWDGRLLLLKYLTKETVGS